MTGSTSDGRTDIRFEGYGIRQNLPRLSARSFPPELPERIQNWHEEGKRQLASPFVGVTTDGTPRAGLFSLQSTGVSTQPIQEAAEQLLAAVSEGERAEIGRPIDSTDWRAWMNPEWYLLRHGLLLESLDEGQREAALHLVAASLSTGGFDTVRNLMRLNELLKELTGNTVGLGEWLYFLTIFGTPSTSEPWGWQLDGHHININCFILGDQVVLTPTMLGAEPAYGDRGPYQGIREFTAERNAGLELMQALSAEQRATATIFPSMLSTELPPERYDFANGRQQAHALRDNVVIPYEGIRADGFSQPQRAALLNLIESHVAIMRPGDARARMAEITRHLDETRLAWIGGYEESGVFYYKVHSPVLLIEFDHHKGIFIDNDEPEPFHIHIIARTPNGNDYGKDLLRQHYAEFPHRHE